MGESGLTPAPIQSFTSVFNEAFPTYLAMGMTYEQFWLDDPNLVIAYRKADDIRRKRENMMMWFQGIYFAEALQATVGNMFTKGQKSQYPSEPHPISQAEHEERKEREQKARMERIKAQFTARALAMNSKMGGQKHDE